MQTDNSMGTTPEPPQTPPTPTGSDNRTLMLILAYLGPFALIPLLVEKDDAEIQWHSKHGLVLIGAWFLIGIAIAIFSQFPIIGWILGCFIGFLYPLFVLIIHIVCIVKALQGSEFRLPVVSGFADQWK